jgi:hypothetical protein
MQWMQLLATEGLTAIGLGLHGAMLAPLIGLSTTPHRAHHPPR